MNTIETQYVSASGNLNTRINPLNRHSKEGFEIRMQKKRNRLSGRRHGGWRQGPIFFQEAD